MVELAQLKCLLRKFLGNRYAIDNRERVSTLSRNIQSTFMLLLMSVHLVELIAMNPCALLDAIRFKRTWLHMIVPGTKAEEPHPVS